MSIMGSQKPNIINESTLYWATMFYAAPDIFAPDNVTVMVCPWHSDRYWERVKGAANIAGTYCHPWCTFPSAGSDYQSLHSQCLCTCLALELSDPAGKWRHSCHHDSWLLALPPKVADSGCVHRRTYGSLSHHYSRNWTTTPRTIYGDVHYDAHVC